MISPLSNTISPNIQFCAKKKKPKTVNSDNSQPVDDNPVSRKGETMKLITATFVGGLALAGRLLFELFDNGDFLIDTFGELAAKISQKNAPQNDTGKLIENAKNDIDKLISDAKNKSKEIKDKKLLTGIGIFVSLLAVFFCGVALLYTAFHAPKISYESKVNAFKKGKEMDVYIKANEAEKELYTQLDEKAKSSDSKEKEELKEQYLKLKNAKNQVPDFVDVKAKR